MKIQHLFRVKAISAFLLLGLLSLSALAADTSQPIKVLHPKRLGTGELPAERTPLGNPGDYKPWIVRCKNGDLLIVAFEQRQGPFRENALFWRSTDGGKTWGSREQREDIHGREFAATCLADGTLLMTCHILPQDKFNQISDDSKRDWHSKLFRSTDHGHAWSEIPIGWGDDWVTPRAASDRNVLEMPDPAGSGKTTVVLGVGQGRTADHTYLWRSWDSGRTWDKTFQPDTKFTHHGKVQQGWDDVDGFYSNSVSYRAASGRLLHPVRVDATGRYWQVPDLRSAGKEGDDQADRMMLWTSDDNGATWKRYGEHGTFGAGGEMYFRFLKLSDGRLLATFTVRSSSTDGHPLGLRVTISHDDGQTWDFDNDRLVLEQKNHGDSGGGFGNTIQLDDGTLVTVYSYRGQDNATHVEALRWRLPDAK